MKKLISLILILILCLSLAAACGKKTDTPDPDPSPDGSQQQDPDGSQQQDPDGGKQGEQSGEDSGGESSGTPDGGGTASDPEAQPLSWTDRIFTGTFTDESVTKDPLVMLTVYLPKVSGNDDIELYYQGRLDSIKQQAQTTYLDLGRGNYQFASQDIGIFSPVTVEIGYHVLRNDGRLFSVRREVYENTGGAHPSITLQSETFRVSDGAMMVFSDLFTVSYDDAVAKIRPMIEDQMDKRIKEYGSEYYFDDAKSQLFAMWDKSDWYLTDDSLVMYWQTYAISPYVAGVQEFSIPLSELADIIDAIWIS